MLVKTDEGLALQHEMTPEAWAMLRLAVWDVVIGHLEHESPSTDGREGLQQLLYFLRPALEDEIEHAVATVS